jgi:tellurite resistance protein TerC
VGALLLRAIFIIGGVALITTFHYIIYVFGAFLVYTGIKLFFNKDEQIEPEKNPLLKFIRRYIPVTKQYYNDKFFIKRLGHTIATPLFVVLILIESTDVIFAVDSIPAVLAISKDPFIIYTSNIFAILGLRTLYFALAGIVHIFHYLNAGMAIILMFIGAKMLVSDIYKLPIEVALGIVIAILIGSVVLSLLNPRAPQSIVSEE